MPPAPLPSPLARLSRPDETYELPEVPLARRVLVICGWIVTVAAVVIGLGLLIHALQMPIPDMPDGELPRLERVEAFIARALAREEKEAAEELVLAVFLVGALVGVFNALVATSQVDVRRALHEKLQQENQRLKRQIGTLEREVKQLRRKLDEAAENQARIVADLLEPRPAPRPPFGGLFGRKFDSPIEDEYDDFGDEDDEDDNLPPFPPPKKSPTLN